MISGKPDLGAFGDHHEHAMGHGWISLPAERIRATGSSGRGAGR
jgi:hypothetical protein